MPIHGAPHYLFAEEQVHLQGPKVVGGRPKHRRNERLRFGRSSNRCPRSNSCAFLAIFFSPFRSRFRTSPITHPAYQTGQDSPISAFQRPQFKSRSFSQNPSIARLIDAQFEPFLSIARLMKTVRPGLRSIRPPVRRHRTLVRTSRIRHATSPHTPAEQSGTQGGWLPQAALDPHPPDRRPHVAAERLHNTCNLSAHPCGSIAPACDLFAEPCDSQSLLRLKIYDSPFVAGNEPKTYPYQFWKLQLPDCRRGLRPRVFP